MRTFLVACLATSTLLASARAAAPQHIIPQPVKMTASDGYFRITPRTVIWSDRARAGVARQLARYLEPATGFPIDVVTTGGIPARAIVLRLDPSLKRLGAEGYMLDVRPAGVVARAPPEA